MTNKIHVCQLVPEMKMGGVETGTLDLGEALIEKGFRASVISNGGELVGKLEKQGVEHWNVPVHRKSPFAILKNAITLRRIIAREQIDIVHARSRAPAWAGYLATLGTATHFVTTAHGYYSHHFGSRVMGWGERVITVSNAIREHMVRDFGVHPSRIRKISRGVNRKKFQPPSSCSIKKRGFHIGIIGRLTPLKGHDDFLKAFAVLNEKMPSVRGFIVGDAGKKRLQYKEDLMNLCESLGLRDNMTFMGACSDVSRVLTDLDLVVLATKTPEAFGRVIVEAQAMGVPVIATRVGGVVEIIDDGENGLLVDAGDINAMAEAMERMLTDRDLRIHCSEQGIVNVNERFSLEKMVDKTISVYKEILKEPRILITKFSALGDLVLISPALRAIRQKMEKAHISLIVSPQYASLLKGCPYIDEIILYDKNDKDKGIPSLIRLGRELRQRRFDMGIDFQNNKRSYWLQRIAGASKRIGFRRGAGRYLLTDSLEIDNSLGPIESQRALLSLCGIKLEDEKLGVWPGEEARHRVKRLLEREGIAEGEKLIAINPGSGARWPSKRWPLDRFIALTKLICRNTDYKPVFIGGRDTKEWMQGALDPCRERIVDLIGKTSLPELAALLECCDGLVSGDSGPLHIGMAAGTWVVALFGPTDPLKHLPKGRISVLYKSPECSPCYRGNCQKEKHVCMEEITVESVFDEILKMVKENV